jgi:hypothetical protein
MAKRIKKNDLLNLAEYLVASASKYPEKTAVRHEGIATAFRQQDRAASTTQLPADPIVTVR